MKLSELNQVHSCDKCHKTFKSNEIATVPFGSNVTIIASIYTIIKTGNPKPSDRVMSCPHCSYTHLFGFNRV